MRLFVFTFFGRIFSMLIQRVTQAILNLIASRLGIPA
jgi:hypothetical protein